MPRNMTGLVAISRRSPPWALRKLPTPASISCSLERQDFSRPDPILQRTARATHRRRHVPCPMRRATCLWPVPVPSCRLRSQHGAVEIEAEARRGQTSGGGRVLLARLVVHACASGAFRLSEKQTLERVGDEVPRAIALLV